MPRHISFAWTTPALLAREKSVTRRDWKPQYAKRWREGDPATAYDRSPRYGGKPVGLIRLTHAPYLASTTAVPRSDWWAEGFDYLSRLDPVPLVDGLTPRELWESWHAEPRALYVVRFEIVSLYT